jgi:hypothetical protein
VQQDRTLSRNPLTALFALPALTPKQELYHAPYAELAIRVLPPGKQYALQDRTLWRGPVSANLVLPTLIPQLEVPSAKIVRKVASV